VQIYLITVGNKMPDWVTAGYQEYARRMPRECQLQLIELPPSQRSKSTNLERAIEEEGQRMLKAIPGNCDIIALDVKGKSHSTESLASAMETWMHSGRDIALLVGGADGLSKDCLKKSSSKWSLSNLTFPHPLVRVIVAEQLYRAWSFMNNHPYHRA
jgi:23S rRNA (pseudouridine1915-N3)-methyltransferase